MLPCLIDAPSCPSHPSQARRSELRAHKNLLPQAPSLCRPLSELPDPTALAARLRPPSPDANLESSLQTANPLSSSSSIQCSADFRACSAPNNFCTALMNADSSFSARTIKSLAS